MDILDTVRADLRGATLARQREVAEATKVPWGTLRKIVDGDTENPRYGTVEALRRYYASSPPPSPEERAA